MATVSELNQKIERFDERIGALEQNHNGLNEKLIRLDAKMDGYNKDLKHMADTIIEVRADVKTLVSEPGKKWNSVTMFVVTSIIGIIIGFILNTILK